MRLASLILLIYFVFIRGSFIQKEIVKGNLTLAVFHEIHEKNDCSGNISIDNLLEYQGLIWAVERFNNHSFLKNRLKIGKIT